MADSGGHAADLTVFAFGEFEGEPAVANVFPYANRWVAWSDAGRCIETAGTAGKGAVVADGHAECECFEGGSVGDAFDLDPVLARVCVPRIEETVDERTLVGEEEQAFAIGIEAADWVDARREFEIRERRPRGTGLGRELREDAVGFVEGDEQKEE